MYIYVHTYVCMYMHTYMCMYACIYLHVSIYIIRIIYISIYQENEQRIVMEEKKRKREEQKKLEMERKIAKGGKQALVPPPMEDDGNIVDRLLQEIRDGTSLRRSSRRPTVRRGSLKNDEIKKLQVMAEKSEKATTKRMPSVTEEDETKRISSVTEEESKEIKVKPKDEKTEKSESDEKQKHTILEPSLPTISITKDPTNIQEPNVEEPTETPATDISKSEEIPIPVTDVLPTHEDLKTLDETISKTLPNDVNESTSTPPDDSLKQTPPFLTTDLTKEIPNNITAPHPQDSNVDEPISPKKIPLTSMIIPPVNVISQSPTPKPSNQDSKPPPVSKKLKIKATATELQNGKDERTGLLQVHDHNAEASLSDSEIQESEETLEQIIHTLNHYRIRSGLKLSAGPFLLATPPVGEIMKEQSGGKVKTKRRKSKGLKKHRRNRSVSDPFVQV